MTPQALAALHARTFKVPRPYSAAEFAAFLDNEFCFLIAEPKGFVLGRAVADEAELLTLAVEPQHRRRGVGRRLLQRFEAEAVGRGAEHAFLEVASGNAAAIALYAGAGYATRSRRKGYFQTPGGPAQDALLLCKALAAA